jgi:prepilin-type N-terminal cleavage/methylation domain-containing protein
MFAKSCSIIRNEAFTLIELLIVVAIIAILAAIAVPNFLEAQTRSKVARIKSDMRTLATGIEAYAVDHNRYLPIYHEGRGEVSEVAALAKLPATATTAIGYDYIDICGKPLTTPIAYLAAIAHPSPFQERNGEFNDRSFYFARNIIDPTWNNGNDLYGDWYGFSRVWSNANAKWWLMDGGPNRIWYATAGEVQSPYDPTNGTVSVGNIWWVAGGRN